MKVKISLLNIVLFFYVDFVCAQYTNIKVDQQPQQIEIVQIDCNEYSTLIYMKYVSQEENSWININDKACIRLSGTEKKYPLINSFNLPISMEAMDCNMLFDNEGQEHCFVLEFEKIPMNAKFDIMEMECQESVFNIGGVEVDTTQVSEYQDIGNFIADYPVKELGIYVKDGRSISWIKANEIVLTISVQKVKQYGKYYQVDMRLQNFSDKPILFNTEKIKAKGYFDKESVKFPLEILSSYEYDKKVARRQAWGGFSVALAEGLAAASAGYSRSTTTYVGGTLYTTSYGQSYTTTYNGAAAYAAQQNAAANYERYARSQKTISHPHLCRDIPFFLPQMSKEESCCRSKGKMTSA